MKNLKFWTLVLISLLIVSMTACKGSTNGTYIGSDKQPLNITIAANESITFAKTARTGSRTIVAAPFEADSTLTFYLWGKAQSGQILHPKTVTVTSTDGITGKVILDIDCYNWSLTIAACETSDLPTAAGANLTEAEVLAKAVLVGYGNVDMQYSNDIKFTLTPKGLSKVGTVNLSLVLESGTVIPDGYVATAFIYDITTGEEIKSAETTPAALSTVLDIDELEGTGASYTANDKDIKPGTYRFQVEFEKQNEKRKYVWNDTIIILPGKEVQDDIIIPNLVGTKPAAPDDFKVEFNKYIDKDTGVLTDEFEEVSYPGFYVAHFTWDGDDVRTEMNFAMQIAELADDFDLSTLSDAVDTEDGFDEIWNTAANYNAQYSFDYLNDIRKNTRFYKGGSLFANSDYVDVYLELGKRYIARLYSENNAGYSTDASYLEITPVETGATMETINRFRVKYVVQGGKWNTGENKGSEPAGSTKDKIVYWSQSDQEYTVLNPVKDASTGLGTANSPYLYNGAADWIYWIKDLTAAEPDDKYASVAGASTYTPKPYDSYKNLTLYAAYSREGDVEIYNDSTYDLLQAWINAFGMTGTVSKVATNTVSKGTNLSNAATTTVAVTVPSTVTGAWKYDKVAFSINYAGRTYFDEEQVGAANGSANTFTIALANLPTGYVYNCLITAQYQMTTVSYPFTVYLTD